MVASPSALDNNKNNINKKNINKHKINKNNINKNKINKNKINKNKINKNKINKLIITLSTTRGEEIISFLVNNLSNTNYQ